MCWKDTGCAAFLNQHSHNTVTGAFTPPSLFILHPKVLPTLQCRLQSPVASLSFCTLSSDLGHYAYMQQLRQMPLQSSQNQAPGQNQLYWMLILTSSAKKRLPFPFLALEELLQNTPVCAATILLVRASHFLSLASCLLYMVPQLTGSSCQALMQRHHLPGPARHGYMLLLLFLLLKGEAKIAYGTCNAKIPGAFWPSRGMVFFIKLFPGSPLDLGNGKLALSKWTLPKYFCCAAGLVHWYAQGRQAGSCLGYQWHVLAENHHCMLLLIWLSLVPISKLAWLCLAWWSSRLRLWYPYHGAMAGQSCYKSFQGFIFSAELTPWLLEAFSNFFISVIHALGCYSFFK